MKIKQFAELESQPGLDEETITQILKKRDVNKAYKIALESLILFYHLTDRNVFPTEEDYFKAFPFTVHYLDGGTVSGQLLKKYEQEKHIW